jgi:hypothetical protein
MAKSIVISSIALIISIAGFLFTLFQFNRNQRLKKLEKINGIMSNAYNLRRSSEDLKHLIEISDDIDAHEEALNLINIFTESLFSKALNNPKTKISEIYSVEQRLLKTTLEFDLLSKQINEQIRFHKECAGFDCKHNVK